MCGHVGYISRFNNGMVESNVKAFEEMLYIDALRGDDATGICHITNKQEATVLKEAAPSTWFLLDGDYEKERKKFTSKAKALLGHNRKATMGGRKDEHAHPFMFDDRFVFFHNGTLHNHKSLANTEVDSEALGQHLVKCEGDVEQIATLLEKVYGAWACVWYDADKHTVYFLRNSQRPLAFIITELGDIAYASEAWMAAGTIIRNNGKVKDIKNLEIDKLYSIDLNGTTLEIKEEALPKKAKAPYTYTPVTTISKKEAKGLINDFKCAPYIGFFPDSAVSTTGSSDASQPQDWWISGDNPEYEGTVFKFYAKNLYKHEVDAMCTGKYVTGIYNNHEHKQGTLIVTLSSCYWKSYTACMN